MNRFPASLICYGCLLLIGLLASGCAAPRTVVWTRDSKSLIFGTDDGGLAAIDIDTRSKRRIPVLDPCWCARPGLSPNGDQVALVSVESSTEADFIQILAQDMTGHRRHQSEVYVWPADNGQLRRRVPRRTSAYWSQDGKSLLLWFTSGTRQRNYFARYDWEQRRLTPLTDTLPAVDLFSAGMTPFREDDSGYLALRTSADGVQDVFFVNWTGWESPLSGRRELLLFERPTLTDTGAKPTGPPTAKPNPRGAELPGMHGRLPITAGRWKLGKLNMTLGRGEVELNSVDRTTQYRQVEGTTKAREALADQRVFLRVPIGNGAKFHARVRASKAFGLSYFMVELANVENQQTLPLGRMRFADGEFCPIVPSPDGKSVAMTYADENGRVFTTVIDDEGQFRSTTQISGIGWADGIVSDRPANVAMWQPDF